MQRERIEILKEEYTDQYVVVDAGRPEFARFKGLVGQVRTINMNGRALVEFEGRNDRGRYDIELDFLKVVEKPEPKPPPEKPKPKAKPAAKRAAKKPVEKPAEEPAPAEAQEQLSALEVARMKDPSGNTVSKPDPKAAKPAPPAERPGPGDEPSPGKS
jgi:hypothetical protein